MLAAYSRPTCGFFDPSIKNGGPDLDPELNPRMKQRKPVNKATNRAKRSSRNTNHSRKRRSNLATAPIRNSDDMLRYRKKADPLVSIQGLLIGLRQWSERYINECHGQRGFKYIATKGQKFIRNVFRPKLDSATVILLCYCTLW